MNRAHVEAGILFVISLCMALLWGAAFPRCAMAEGKAAEVPPADLASLGLDDFADDELAVPFYLAHLHRVANSIEMSGPRRGFITLPVWRPKRFNKPFNARVLENHVCLAYFYCTDRPWNPYHKHPALRARLEALLSFLCDSQNDEGWFSEYRPKGWNLPATGFATMFLGETLRLLHDGPPIDRAVHNRVIEAHRKSIGALLTSDSLFNAGMSCSNQYSGLWGGALAHLDLYPDDDLMRLLRRRLADSLKHHQSPAGYWYENRGCDWPYTLRTHTGNVLMAWHYARGTELAKPLVEGEERWTEWRAFNCLLEPDDETYVLNRAIDSRTSGSFRTRHNPMSEVIPLARAFMPTRQEVRAEIEEKRKELAASWPKVPNLEVGHHHAYSPHVILNLDHHRWVPTAEQRKEAVRRLPYLARDHFTHQRADDDLPQVYTFVRRPPYYAVFNAGKSLRGQQRYGLGMLWSPELGTFLQSQSGSHDAAWGTRGRAEKDVYEIELTDVRYAVGEQTVTPRPGKRDLPAGPLVIAYPLGEHGRKQVTFGKGCVTVHIDHKGAFTEQLPILLPRDVPAEVRVQDQCVLICREDQTPVRIASSVERDPEVVGTDTSVAGKSLVLVKLSAADRLEYTIRFAAGAAR